jgi:hypothetical protein
MSNLQWFWPWLGAKGKLIDQGDNSFAPLVAVTAPGALPVSGIVAAAPAYSGFAAVTSPAALSPVLSLTLVNAGLYRLEYNLFTDDGPGQGKFIFLQLPDGSQIEAAGPYGARGVITALSVTASAVCKVFSGTVTTVGSRYSALLRAYAL